MIESQIRKHVVYIQGDPKKRNTFKIGTIQYWDNGEKWGEDQWKQKTLNDKITKIQSKISKHTRVMLF